LLSVEVPILLSFFSFSPLFANYISLNNQPCFFFFFKLPPTLFSKKFTYQLAMV
jgi:hypothetical protein